MSWYPDPDAIRAHAARLIQHADRLRELACGVDAAADGTPWQGLASDRFRHEVDVLRLALTTAADGLTGAALALRAHATTVEGEIVLLRTAVQEGFEALNGPVGTVNAQFDLSAFTAPAGAR